jgi:hypothetical protein
MFITLNTWSIMTWEDCRKAFPVSTDSPLATLVNGLLWGDWDKGEFGVLVRTMDVFEDSEALAEKNRNLNIDEKKLTERVYLPGSFLHASMRAPGATFAVRATNPDFFIVLVGTKYKQNWAMKEFQLNGTVDCPNYYPADAATVERGVLEDPNGTFCRPATTRACCVNGTCLARHDSACGECKIPGSMFGDHVANYAAKRHRKLQAPSFLTCWYPNSRHGLENMVTASNTLWQQRYRWNYVRAIRRYAGYTECPVTINIRDPEMIDCLVVPIFSRRGHSNRNVCSDKDRVAMQKRLRRSYHSEYGALPILFYSEVKGMPTPECERLWGGIDCDDGYKRDFFAQEFKFDDGSCVHRPVGCKAEYYFPPHNDSDPLAGCSAFTEKGARRIELLRATENRTGSIKDPVVVASMRVPSIVRVQSGIGMNVTVAENRQRVGDYATADWAEWSSLENHTLSLTYLQVIALLLLCFCILRSTKKCISRKVGCVRLLRNSRSSYSSRQREDVSIVLPFNSCQPIPKI